MIVDGHERFFATAADRDRYLAEHDLLVKDEELDETGGAEPAGTNGQHRPTLEKSQDLHEVAEIGRIVDELGGFELPVDDYYLTREEGVTGEYLPTKYVLTQGERRDDVAGVGDLLPRVHEMGKRGIEVQRFKGLGEMNAEQLWETTLDPDERVLMRVTLEEATEADRLFSVLMGEDVEKRRQYIETHALEVKNLDV